jgi:NADH-quinone oxidoreductase subunit E
VLSDEAKRELTAILTKYPDKRSAVIAALYLAQSERAYLTDEEMAEVAGLLDMPPTAVHSVAGFYTLLRDKPGGRYILEVCTDLPCALRGAEEFLHRLCALLGVRPGETTPDGLFTVEEVMCVAACDKAPAVQVNLEYHENLSEENVRELLDRLRHG